MHCEVGMCPPIDTGLKPLWGDSHLPRVSLFIPYSLLSYFFFEKIYAYVVYLNNPKPFPVFAKYT